MDSWALRGVRPFLLSSGCPLLWCCAATQASHAHVERGGEGAGFISASLAVEHGREEEEVWRAASIQRRAPVHVGTGSLVRLGNGRLSLARHSPPPHPRGRLVPAGRQRGAGAQCGSRLVRGATSALLVFSRTARRMVCAEIIVAPWAAQVFSDSQCYGGTPKFFTAFPCEICVGRERFSYLIKLVR